MNRILYSAITVVLIVNSFLFTGVMINPGISTGRASTAFYINSNNPPIFSDETPSNEDINVYYTITTLSVYIEDLDGDSFDWSIETSPYVGSNKSYNENDGIKTCIISNLAFDTTYTWFVNATDVGSGTSTNMTFNFTVEQYVPTISYFEIRGKPHNEYDCSPYKFEEDIYNWTGPDHRVKICWKISNDYDTNRVVEVKWRIREWQVDIGPLALLLFFTKYGTVKLPDYDYEWPKLTSIENLVIRPYEYKTGELFINLHIYNPNGIIEIPCLTVAPDKSSFTWPGIRIYF